MAFPPLALRAEKTGGRMVIFVKKISIQGGISIIQADFSAIPSKYCHRRVGE